MTWSGPQRGKYVGAPLRKIQRLVCDDQYARTGWHLAVLECGHAVRRFGYVRLGTYGGPRGVKYKRCRCVKCRDGEPEDDLPLDAFDAGKVVTPDP